jgi:hypothetical protein
MWEDNTKMELEEIGGEAVDRIRCFRLRISAGSCCECGNEPSGFIKCGPFLDSSF